MKAKKIIYDLLHEEELKNEKSISSNDLLFDYEFVLKDYYNAQVKNVSEYVIVSFKNGQRFKVDISEI